MNGYEAIKNKRIEKGYSLKEFAELLGIVNTTLIYYENGTSDLRKLPLGKAVSMFGALQLDIENFFEEYYSVKRIMDEKVENWHQCHPRVDDFEVLKGRLYARCYKACARSRASVGKRDALMKKCKDTLRILSMHKKEDGCIPDSAYKEYILPLQYEINMLNEREYPNPITAQITGALYKSELNQQSICELCEISVKNFDKYKNGSLDYCSMRVVTALNLCAALELEFSKVFLPLF